MDFKQLISAEDQLQVNPLDRAMYNWLAAWRSLTQDSLRLQTTTMRFQQLIELAKKQIKWHENILRDQQFLNNKGITNDGVKNLLWHKEYRERIQNVISLQDELCLAHNTLEKHKLQLKRFKEKLLKETIKTQRIEKSLKESKHINKKLRIRNLTLHAVKKDTVELYRSRDLMFVYQLIEKAKELINAQNKTKAVASVSTYLQTNIEEIQLQESVLLRQLAAGTVERNANFKYRHIFLQYIDFLWECMSSLAHCPKLESPYKKFQDILDHSCQGCTAAKLVANL
ncbi:uncharacterized protein LOC117792005 [Drosophila innubila]|uniref:uncharacterized protein LOC117792005 n=1 Tax=Drosophila innubila TaxID=198719 RepID=UPI00148DCA29|nr:uncharacterized protein LOC117792005 [Drosophila innubila]